MHYNLEVLRCRGGQRRILVLSIIDTSCVTRVLTSAEVRCTMQCYRMVLSDAAVSAGNDLYGSDVSRTAHDD